MRDELAEILDSSDDIFIAEIRKFQVSIFSAVRAILKKFVTKGGKFQKDETNRRILLSVKSLVTEAIKKSTLTSKVDKYISNFGKARKLNEEIYSASRGSKLPSELSALISQEQKEAISELKNAILSDAAIEANFVQPIRRILTRHVTTGISLKDAENELREFIKDNPRGGFAERYIRTYARESLSQYDGYVNQLIVNDTQPEFFQISGSLIANSHINCIEMVNGKGTLGKFHIGKGIYPICVLDQMLTTINSRTNDYPSKRTTDNYFQIRNHPGCRHSLTALYALPDDLKSKYEEIKEKYC